MTSLRRDTSTSCPTPMPSRSTLDTLWRTTNCTVAPPISIGSTFAIGVTRPVGPVSQLIAMTRLTFASEANL